MSRNIIKERLYKFKRRYFLNQLLKGIISFLISFSFTFLFFTLIEGILWLKPTVKTVLFFTFVGITAFILGRYIIYPLYKLLTMDKFLSDEEAAKIIGKHFPQIQDKLLNLLQLEQLANSEESELLIASIEQKTEELKPYPFHFSVKFTPTLKKAKYLLIPLAIILLILFIDGEVLTKGTKRFIKYDKEFLPPPPFKIEFVEKPPATIVENSDLNVKFKITGKKVPKEIYAYVKFQDEEAFNKYSVENTDNNTYVFTLKNVSKNLEFYIGNKIHRTNTFSVKILRKPYINDVKIVLNYPKYTNLGTDTIAENPSDISVLKGTEIYWEIKTTENTKDIYIVLGNKEYKAQKNKNKFTFSHRILENTTYYIKLLSKDNLTNPDTTKYKIQVIEDQYPSVNIIEPSGNTLLPKDGIVTLLFEATDDYGFSKLQLLYRITQSDEPRRIFKNYKVKNLNIGYINSNFIRKELPVDFFELGIESGDVVEYYLKIWDNDYISGPKYAISNINRISYADVKKQYEEFEKGTEKVESSLDSLHKELEEMQKSVDKFKEKFLQKKSLNYQEQQSLKQSIQEQKKMLKEVDEVTKELEKNLKMSEENSLLSEETQKKMEELKKFLDDLKDEELQNLLKKLEQELKQNKPPSPEELKQLQNKQELLKQQIEQIMELLKQLRFEQKIDELYTKLNELKEKQDFLQEKNQFAKNKEERKQLAKDQEQLKQKFEDFKKEMQELDSIASEQLKQDLQDLKQIEEEISQEMQQAKNSLQQGSKKQSSKHQKNASQKMQKMMEKLSQMKRKSQLQRDMENYEDMRALLENILNLSFAEEDLYNKIKKLRYNDPAVTKATEQQLTIKENFQIVKDSLIALSKRAIQVKSFILKKTYKIENLMDKTLEYGTKRAVYPASVTSRETMKELNELANMLVESLKDLQNQINSQKSNMNKACQKPSAGAGQSMRKIAKQQQMLNQLMQELAKRMQQQGQNKNQSQSQKDSRDEAAQEYQKLAEKQRQIREQLQELYNKMKENGEKGLGDLNKVMQQMKQTEQELIDKIISEATLKRQQQILDRLLDYDKSMREKDWDKKRKSKSAKNQKYTGNQLPEEFRNSQIYKDIYKKKYLKYTPIYQKYILLYHQNLTE